jgi:hypothetical protein
LNLIDCLKEPESFKDAYYLPNHEDRMKWREAISKEFDEMKEKEVYEKICKSELPNGRTCIKNKWVFKIKRNGIFRARLVACGYSQVPGVDFQESFAPVINDVTFRILLIMMLTWNLKGKIVDIETAFLHGNLKETIYMEIPKGMEANENECLILKKTIYGLIQSAREFYKKLVLALKRCGFKETPSIRALRRNIRNMELCLLEFTLTIFRMIGNEKDINDVINGLKTYKFGLKIANDLKDYLNCRILTDYVRKSTFVMQPHSINNIKEKLKKKSTI